jgi:hypothetical protein
MNWTVKIVLTVVAAVVVVAVALWLGRVHPKSAPAENASPSESVRSATTNRIVSTTGHPRGTNRLRHVVLAPGQAQTNVDANFEAKIEEILGSKDEPAEQGRKLFALFGHLPAETQAETAQHIANLLADEDYQPFGMQLADTNTASAVQDVIFADLLNRPNNVKLPLLLEVAKTPDHPKATEAKEMLQLYLETDYRDNWDMWKDKINEWLLKNPETP